MRKYEVMRKEFYSISGPNVESEKDAVEIFNKRFTAENVTVEQDRDNKRLYHIKAEFLEMRQ